VRHPVLVLLVAFFGCEKRISQPREGGKEEEIDKPPS
jgi:hypothetical protein